MEYLRLREWKNKFFSLPNIPRNENYVKSLFKYLEQKVTANNLMEKNEIRLGTNGFLQRDENNEWKLTAISNKLLEEKDEKILFLYFTRTVNFFGEILYLLEQKRLNIGMLLKIANKKYGIVNWKTKAQVSLRLQWLKDLGLITYSDFENLYAITKKGQNYLKLIKDEFEEITSDTDYTDEYDDLIKNVPHWIFEIENKESDKIGYIPGKNDVYLQTIIETLELIKTGRNEIASLRLIPILSELKETSLKQFIKTLVNLDLIKRISLTEYTLTHFGEKVLVLDDFQFVFFLDKKNSFVLEILHIVNEKPQTMKEILAVSQGKYSMIKVDISRRLKFLEKADLIYKIDYYTYSITNLGKAVIDNFNIQNIFQPVDSPESKLLEEDFITDSLEALLIELRQAASDSTNPKRFEKSVKDCFTLIGFDCELLGNSGETDVLAQTKMAPASQYKLVIDAKSTSSPSINESVIDFDTLKDHRRKHNADYIIVVAIKFTENRLIDRAKNHNVALIDVETLSELLKNHHEVPLGYQEYEKIFSEGGLVDLDTLTEDRNHLIYQKEVIYKVLEVLTEEITDEVTHGVLTSRDIYMVLKNNHDFNSPPTIEQIDEVLKFLSSPFIRGIEKIKNGYSARGSVNEISNILNFLSQ